MNTSQMAPYPFPVVAAGVGDEARDDTGVQLDAPARGELREVLLRLWRAVSDYRIGARVRGPDGAAWPVTHLIGIGHLPSRARAVLDKLLGEGSDHVERLPRSLARFETGLRGIWRVGPPTRNGRSGDYLEIAEIPSSVRAAAGARRDAMRPDAIPRAACASEADIAESAAALARILERI